MNEVLTKIQNFVSTMKIQNDIENVVIRKEDLQIFVWFIFNKKIEVNLQWLAFLLGKNCAIFKSTHKTKPQHVAGPKEFKLEEFGLECKFPVDSFHQVNKDVYKKLYQKAVKEVTGENVLNAYSGGGVLSGIIARNGKNVFGIELGVAEHKSAESLKEENKLDTLTNIQGDCAKILPTLDIRFDSIIVDPPRLGCDKAVCQAINDNKASRIIYISCNPATFVRDVSLLTNYKIKEVTLFDMFPRTANYETLTVLELKNE